MTVFFTIKFQYKQLIISLAWFFTSLALKPRNRAAPPFGSQSEAPWLKNSLSVVYSVFQAETFLIWILVI